MSPVTMSVWVKGEFLWDRGFKTVYFVGGCGGSSAFRQIRDFGYSNAFNSK